MRNFFKLLSGKPIKVIALNQWRHPNMIGRVMDKELEGCVDLVRANLGHSQLFSTSKELRDYCLTLAPDDGLVLEFGVFKGNSINQMADRLVSRKDGRTIHGFDSFEGLSHDGHGWIWPKGKFNQKGSTPKVRRNVQLHKGWIDGRS